MERFPCHVCGAIIVRPHNSFECAWRLRDERDQLRRELAASRAGHIEALSALVELAAMVSR